MDEVKEVVRQHWDRRAADFDQGPSHGLLNAAQARAWRRLLANIGGAKPLDVLDVGCGTGFLALLLAEQGHRVSGVDVAPAMLALARSKAADRGLNVRFDEADVENLDLPKASVDLIVERHVLWTLPDPDSALNCWRSLLRPAGRLVLIEGNWDRMPERTDEYAAIRDRLPLFGGRPEAEVADRVRSRGFASIKVESLMDPDLWTEPPAHARYMVTAQVEP